MRQWWWGIAILVCVSLLPAAAQRKADPNTAFKNDPLALALKSSNVYVGKTLRAQVDEKALRDMASKAPKDRPVKLAVVKQLPESGKVFGNRDSYTRALHKALNLGRGTLVIVTEKGVSASTNGLAPERITAVLKQDAQAIHDDPVRGIDRALTDLYDAMDKRTGSNETAPAGAVATETGTLTPAQFPEAQRSHGLLDSPLFLILPVGAFLLFTVGIFGAIFGLFGHKGKQQALRQAQTPVERLRGEVVNGLTYVDTYLELLPPSAELSANVRLRQDTATLYEQAKGLTQRAKEPQEYGRAEALLEQANQNIQSIKQFIDRATGGTGFALAVEGTNFRATPGADGGATQPAPVLTGLNPADIPAAERAACFFCSRPARISDLTPVTIALNGQRRKVLACADDIHTVQQGATPQVRTVMEAGRPTAWYHARSYDPYRDYAYTHASYYPPYAYYDAYGSGGFWNGFLLGSIFYEPYPVAYPVFLGNDGYITNDSFAAAPPLPMQESGGYMDTSSDFFGGNAVFDSGGSADFSGQDSGGGTDFGGQDNSTDFGTDNSGSVDFGSSDSSSDSGGGFDFGGGDSGGSDFGGGDSGGGDSGGGGDY